MREDDYTGNPLGDDDIELPAADIDLYEFDPDDEALANEFAALAEYEQIISIGDVADGAKSLREVAELLYDYADELLELSGEGWEIVDDILNGQGTAVRFNVEEQDGLEPTDG